MKGYGHHELVATLCSLAYLLAPVVLTRDDPLYGTFVVGVGVLVVGYVAIVVIGGGGFQWWRGLKAERDGQEAVRHDGRELSPEQMVAYGRARVVLGTTLVMLVSLSAGLRVWLHGIDPFAPGLW